MSDTLIISERHLYTDESGEFDPHPLHGTNLGLVFRDQEMFDYTEHTRDPLTEEYRQVGDFGKMLIYHPYDQYRRIRGDLRYLFFDFDPTQRACDRLDRRLRKMVRDQAAIKVAPGREDDMAIWLHDVTGNDYDLHHGCIVPHNPYRNSWELM